MVIKGVLRIIFFVLFSTLFEGRWHLLPVIPVLSIDMPCFQATFWCFDIINLSNTQPLAVIGGRFTYSNIGLLMSSSIIISLFIMSFEMSFNNAWILCVSEIIISYNVEKCLLFLLSISKISWIIVIKEPIKWAWKIVFTFDKCHQCKFLFQKGWKHLYFLLWGYDHFSQLFDSVLSNVVLKEEHLLILQKTTYLHFIGWSEGGTCQEAYSSLAYFYIVLLSSSDDTQCR